MACPKCGRDHKRSKTGPCPACAMRAYRETEKGKAATAEAKRRYEQSEKGKRTRARYIREYRLRRGEYVPVELHELRRASKRLEASLAHADDGEGVRVPGEPGRDDGAE